MNLKGKIAVFALIFGLSFVMTQFQNCAPQTAQNLQAQTDNPQVRIVEDWNVNKVVFVQPQLEINANQADIELYGFCDRQAIGDQYSWAVYSENEDGTSLVEGDSICERGGFRVQLENTRSLECGRSYKVYINDASGPRDVMFISKNCG